LIYFIQQGRDGPIKIGFSQESPESRLASLQTGNPVKLRLLGYVEGDVPEEKAYHTKFKKERLMGEWFKASERLVSEIKRLPFLKRGGRGVSCGNEIPWHKLTEEEKLLERIRELEDDNMNLREELSKYKGQAPQCDDSDRVSRILNMMADKINIRATLSKVYTLQRHAKTETERNLAGLCAMYEEMLA
jgi:hypothetical protein